MAILKCIFRSRSGTLSGERVSLSKAFSQSHIDAAIAPL
jgi:hypothetical protein